MKILFTRVLIMLLFHIDATFPETIQIDRFFPNETRRNWAWKLGVDTFYVPKSACCEYSTYCTKDETDDRYSCSCSTSSATLTNLNKTWRCLKNEEVRIKLGCQKNNLMFPNENNIDRLRTLDDRGRRITKLTDANRTCDVNISASWYIECDGKKVPLSHHINATKEMFFLDWDVKKTRYFIKVRNPIDIFRGRVINLGISCSNPLEEKGCLLFKLLGNISCPFNAKIVFTPITPTSISTATKLTTWLPFTVKTTYKPSQTVQTQVKTTNKPSKTVQTQVNTTNTPSKTVQTQVKTTNKPSKTVQTQVKTTNKPSKTVQTQFQTTTQTGIARKHKNDDVGSSSSNSLGIIVGVTVSVPLALLLIAGLLIYRRRRLRKEANSSTSENVEEQNSSNYKTNSAFQLEEQDHYVTSNKKEPFGEVYTVPQKPSQRGSLRYQNTRSTEENAQYAALNIPEGHNIYGPGSAQEPVYNVLQDPNEMDQTYGCLSTGQPVYNVLEDISSEDTRKCAQNAPYQKEAVYNVLQGPCGDGSEEPAWYGSSPVNDPFYNTLEGPPDQNVDSHHVKEPVYNVLEVPGLGSTGEEDRYSPAGVQDPVYNVLEGPHPGGDSNSLEFQYPSASTNAPVYAVVNKKFKGT